ncbi:MAG: hypothetical protein ACI9XP_001561 [Lentimonas sp.]|jgi:uncharacterized protein
MNLLDFIKLTSNFSDNHINAAIALFEEGATIPFISRYRKERTGGMDEVQIGQIRDEIKLYKDILSRQKTIIKAIDEQGQMSDSLLEKINSSFDLTGLEDIYLPYKQKRQTKGEKAKKRGLEPLAKMIMSQRGGDPIQMANRYIKGEVIDEEMAIEGARDIIAEWINENASLRDRLRKMYLRSAVISSKLVKGKEEEAVKYRDYFEHSEAAGRCPSHRFLAIMRASNEGFLKVKVQPPSDEVIFQIERFFVKGDDECAQQVAIACKEAFQRMLGSSLENEIIASLKEKADLSALKVFTANLRELLLAAPLGNKRILAIDPGFRTGCKVVCLDESGTLLTNATIFPHAPQNKKSEAQSKISQLVEAYKVDVIAIGDGTAGRETETIIKHMRFNTPVEVYVVREDGASIYSASSVARKEFPDYDVTVRGTVSIGRRLMDPLAELVKIDPKSLGVGSYQHEVNQTLLKTGLDDVVVSCVNAVGVDVNTASPYLLQYVSGLGPTLAENIIKYRTEFGGFTSRDELKKVPRMGDKAYEQAAGFLRVRNGKNPLDNSGVHPESYHHVKSLAQKGKLKVEELIGNKEIIEAMSKSDFPDIDDYTFKDIIEELKKPGRDPRQMAKTLEFDHRLKSIDDIVSGMNLTGIVTNVTSFGAFVNIGIKENGLIHKSQLTDSYVEDPNDYIRLHEHVDVQVLEVDISRKRIGLKKLN